MKPFVWLGTAAPLFLAVQSALAGNLINHSGFEGGVLPWTSTNPS